MENTTDKPASREAQDEWKSAPYQSSILPAELPAELQLKAEPTDTEAPSPISSETRFGLGVLGAALLSGLLGDALLRATPWGINVLAWMTGLVASVTVLLRWQRPQLMNGAKWLAVPVIFFAAAFAWRDSATLKFLDAMALLGLLVLAAFRARTGRMLLAGVMEYAQGAIFAGVFAAGGGLPLVFSDIRWRELPRDGWSRQALAAGRGLALAVPLLLVFGGRCSL